MSRAHVSLKTKLAATLLQMVRYDECQAEFVRIISYAESKTMTADQIISRFHFDHGIPHAHGGVDEPWNLTPMPVAAHRAKTSNVDVPRIAKAVRIDKANDQHVQYLREKLKPIELVLPKLVFAAPNYGKKWPSRKLQSRNTFKRRKAST